MKNNKGFTLIELLAVITIIAIMGILMVTGYTRYIYYTRNKAYDTMAKSAANAASEYSMDYIGIDSVTLEELTEGEYMEYPKDPSKETGACKGKVDITYSEEENALEEQTYKVTICCANYNYIYNFPGGSKEKVATCPVE